MKRKAWLSRVLVSTLVPASLALVAGGAQAAPTRVGDFGLIDHLGDQYQLTRLGHKKAIVLISQANSCAENIDQMHRYKLMRTTYQRDDIQFLMLNASTEDSLDSIRRTAEIYDIDFPILVDESQLVAESLKINGAGEILVIDPKTSQLVYRGPLDKPVRRRRGADQNAEPPKQLLADSMARVIAGEHAKTDTISVEVPDNGCGYEFPVAEMHAKAAPDYAKDVAPILAENCAHCHIEGGIGPFAIDSYELVRGWAPMMREVVMTKRMPPAQVDPRINHFTNANYLSAEDTQTLVHWFDAGSPRGESKEDPLKMLPAIAEGWQLDTPPDVVIDVPSFTVPPTGVLDYFNNQIELNFEEDKYVKAVQFIPGDKRVLHHLLAYAVSPRNEEGVLSEENVRDFLEGYAPGKTDVTVFPEGAGVFIPKGYNLRMQMHYTTFGKEVVDNTKVGLWFADEKPEYKFLTKSVSLGGRSLVIPPNEHEHKMNNSFVFENDTMLYAMRPHMHYRGKAFRFSVIYPDGKREILMNVPNYNFAWQPTYRLAEPKFLPAGSRVVNDATFDNSEFNPGNPDPDALVKGGAQSWDEMFIGYYTYTDLGKSGKKSKKQKLTSN